jgi:hypothetical protein
MSNRLYFVIVLLFAAFVTNAQNTTIKGVVTDSITGEKLPYVSIVFKGTTIGTATDDDGNFNFSTSSPVKTIEVSYLGYDTKTIILKQGRVNSLDVKLAPSGIALNEVVVKPKKEKYSKKENPAVEFVKHVIESRESNDPRNHDYFTYDQYEKMIFALNDYQPKPRKDGKKGKFDFISEFIDTLEVGTTVLPISEKEKIQRIYYRKEPKKERKVVVGDKSSGIDEIFSRDGIAQLLNEVFKEVNIFQNDIPLFLMRFPSPLSTIGPNYYKYYLLDTLQMNDRPVVDLGFVPFNSETFAFTGHLYVTLDSTYFVQKAILNVPKDINLNFVSGMTIEQDFSREPDGTRILDKDDIKVNFKLSEKEKGMYARRLNIFRNHSFEPIVGEEELVFKEAAPVVVSPEARMQSAEFWAQNRPDEGKNRNQNNVQQLMQRLRQVPVFHISEVVIKTLVQGYIPTNKEDKSKFEFGPMNTTISGNAIEGARFRVGGTTTKNFSKHFFMDGYLAYGTKDKKLKYDFLAEYSFNERKKYRKEFPVNSIRLEYMYDINQLGQQYMYASKDNMFLAWKRQKDTRATYIRDGKLTYYQERYNGIAFGAELRNLMEYSTEYAVFDKIMADGSINPIKRYDMTSLEFKFRYAKDEKFYQTRNIRYPITFDAWIFNLSHRVALKDFLGSSYNYQRTDIGVQKRLWFSAFGYIDLITKAGKVWTKVPYPLLVLPNANLSYTIQPESYTNMNAMEFLSDQYASWDLTYYLNGNLLNRIPVVKKLKWREVVSFRGMWGSLSDKNNPKYGGEGLFLFPQGSYTFDKEPYMEMGVGLENIFKFLRLDYVWRLNYKNHPGIQTKGVRFMMRMSF